MTDCFIGGHPMAGSEKTGFDHSNERILENAYYILTPGGEVGLEYISDFTELISSLGAIPMVLTAEEHDFITAGVSHLPHIIASALVNLVKTLDNDAEYMKTIAAGGFRDITRIASSSPVMWQQICMENHENISNVLDDYIRMLIQIRCSVDNCATDGKEADAIYQMIASSRITVIPLMLWIMVLSARLMCFIWILQMRPAESLPLPPSLPWTRSALKTSASSTTANSSKAF